MASAFERTRHIYDDISVTIQLREKLKLQVTATEMIIKEVKENKPWIDPSDQTGLNSRLEEMLSYLEYYRANSKTTLDQLQTMLNLVSN